MERLLKYSYVRSLIELHRSLKLAATNAFSRAIRHTPLTKEDLVDFSTNKNFQLLIDFREQGQENILKGYFIFGGYIHRYLTVTFDYVLLFPVSDHCKRGKEDIKGLSCEQVLQLLISGSVCVINFQSIKDPVSGYFYYIPSIEYSDKDFKSANKINVLDDIGSPFVSFKKIDYLKALDIPEALIRKKYKLVGKHQFAPYTTIAREFYCVLYALSNSESSESKIKVLRWFPQKREEANIHRKEHSETKAFHTFMKNKELFGCTKNYTKEGSMRKLEIATWIEQQYSIGDHFFELGFVDNMQCKELHSFMLLNHAPLLFGKVLGDNIMLIDSVKMFFNSDFSYPSSISNLCVK